MIMRQTIYHKNHLQLEAKMASFAGFDMPIRYSSIKKEHLNVRKNVGLFDVSHMGEFILRGKRAFELAQKITTNDVSQLAIGQVQYTCMTNEAGGIIDDLLIYRLGEEVYMMVVNASNIDKDWAWLQKHKPNNDVRLIDISSETALLALQGPKAIDCLQTLTAMDLKSIPYYHFERGIVGGIDNVLVSATGYTGAGGFEIYAETSKAAPLWDALMASGEKYGILPAGLAARDTLRLEMGFCLYGNDMDENTTPLEAGLGWITKFDQIFIGRPKILKQKGKLTKRLVGFQLLEKGIPRKDYAILNEKEEMIGRVTSGTSSPSLDVSIGMGYVVNPYHKVGSEIYISIRDKRIKAEVVKRPFWKA